ncbi:ferrous iron transport protein B [Lacipirellula parvula]|uniref:Ferrous iron transport protein B n=1 Tax=Lacipirellula parvula TaxID=2650471 RepID=A0A5K7X9X3_9BACT|nr:ferrous iron transport protein B [Lacipirellula parvula]BBO32662.1 ferrous iron transport protein B [Lacipirellula parvula]
MSSATPELSLPVLSTPPAPAAGGPTTIALVGNPNAGKTSLFNRLTGLRAKTANFPGTTVEHRRADVTLGNVPVTIVDLPGLYSLDPTTPDERVACQALEGLLPGTPDPDLVLLVVDSTNLERNLFLAGQVLELGDPTVLALNLSDAAEKQGITFDLAELQQRLGCPVVPVSARTGSGIDQLLEVVQTTLRERKAPEVHAELAACGSCNGCQFSARYDWASRVSHAAVRGTAVKQGRVTEAIDRVLTHRFGGLLSFALVMAATFLTIFWAATFPMDLIDSLFGAAGETIGKWIPEGDLQSLLTDGVIGGLGGMLVFLPQICLLFFVLALLEDSGYMARAALVMDRLMHKVGLPGKAFVPLLSAHACAIPAIMSTRVIEDRRDRLATILIAPLMTCSARIPVYAMVATLLFPNSSLQRALIFTAAYALGITAALAMAWVFKRTLLKGPVRPLVIELPNYRLPSLRNALLLTYDRAWAFVKTAGTTILVISLVLWALATYPKTSVDQMPAEVQAQLAELEAAGDEAGVEHLTQQMELEHSFAGRIGRTIEPVFEPLGFDWKMSIGVLSSFAAREVIVSTLAVLYGLGAEGADDGVNSLLASMGSSKHADGSLVFTTATCLSLLVFYVLAMQCLPTQAVTRRETGSWKWPLIQLGYMTALAYVAALVTYQVATRLL